MDFSHPTNVSRLDIPAARGIPVAKGKQHAIHLPNDRRRMEFIADICDGGMFELEQPHRMREVIADIAYAFEIRIDLGADNTQRLHLFDARG